MRSIESGLFLGIPIRGVALRARKDMFGGLRSLGRCASNSPLGALQSLTNGARRSPRDHPATPRTPPRPRTNKASNPTLATIAGLPELGQTLGPACSSIFVRTATKKQGGSSNNGRDSKPKFLGIKKYSGEYVIPGNIIARQRGTKWHCGVNCGIGVDHTVYSLISGRVHFTDAKNPHKPGKKVINVVPHEQWPDILAAAQARNSAKRAKQRVAHA